MFEDVLLFVIMAVGFVVLLIVEFLKWWRAGRPRLDGETIYRVVMLIIIAVVMMVAYLAIIIDLS